MRCLGSPCSEDLPSLESTRVPILTAPRKEALRICAKLRGVTGHDRTDGPSRPTQRLVPGPPRLGSPESPPSTCSNPGQARATPPAPVRAGRWRGPPCSAQRYADPSDPSPSPIPGSYRFMTQGPERARLGCPPVCRVELKAAARRITAAARTDPNGRAARRNPDAVVVSSSVFDLVLWMFNT